MDGVQEGSVGNAASGGQCIDDEGNADFDGEEGHSWDAQGKPQVKKVLRLLTLVSTRWNSM